MVRLLRKKVIIVYYLVYYERLSGLLHQSVTQHHDVKLIDLGNTIAT